jgi:hypothetical protein
VNEQKPKQEARPPDCPTCHNPTRLLTSVLDVKRDTTVPVFFCDHCRREVWD